MRLKQWVALSLLAVATSHAAAQPVIQQLGSAPRAQVRAAVDTPVALYSTLSTMTELYDYGWGPSISAIHTRGPMQFFAMPFTPAVDATFSYLVLPVAASDAKDNGALRVALYGDGGGVPGKAIQSWEGLKVQQSLQPSGFARTCCTYLVPRAEPGSPVTLSAGTTYWVAVAAVPNTRFSGLWYYNIAGLRGNSAYLQDRDGWHPQSDVLLPALGVYGVPN